MAKKIPILMYHKVGEPVRSKADTFLNVSAASFERQMRFLKRMGYCGIPLTEVGLQFRSDATLPKRPICITFDDAYVNNFESAAPILKHVGWPATVFVPTKFVGDSNRWDEHHGRPVIPIMSWEQLADLERDGWEVAGHTHSHPKLGALTDEDAAFEINRGAEEIRSHLGHRPTSFCYPYGSQNASTPALVRSAGMEVACTVETGIAMSVHNPLLLPRVKVAYRDNFFGFLYRLYVRPRLG